MSKPRHPHHCQNCVLLGHYPAGDLYFCRNHRLYRTRTQFSSEPAVAYRWGRLMYQQTYIWLRYAPMVHCWGGESWFAVALRFACRAGFIDKVDAETALAGIPLS